MVVNGTVYNLVQKNCRKFKNQAKLDKSKNVKTCFCILLEQQCQKLISAGENGHWTVFPCSFETLLIFPCFLSFNVLSHEASHI